MRSIAAALLLALLSGCGGDSDSVAAASPPVVEASAGASMSADEVNSMARTLSRPEQTYPAGIYGPFSINGGFTAGDTEELEVVMTVVGWPTASPLFVLSMQWDGQPAPTVFTVPWVSGQLDKAGAPITEARFRIGVPKISTGKRHVVSGEMQIQTFAPITTAITLQAI